MARERIRKHDILYAVDIGTGSGIIALSLDKECALKEIVATDISQKALLVAQKNAQSLDTRVVRFLHADLLSKELLAQISPWDKSPFILVANLPYIAQSEAHSLGEGVLEEDPHNALFGGKETGFELYEELLKQMQALQQKSFLFIGEIGSSQAEIAINISKQYGFDAVHVQVDLCGLSRFFVIDNLK